MPLNSTDPQLGPAMALVALRSEFPHLPAVKWSIEPDGHLMGTCYSPDVFAQYAGFFGVTPMSLGQRVHKGVLKEQQQLFATWRDVEISLWAWYVVDAAPVLVAVAA